MAPKRRLKIASAKIQEKYFSGHANNNDDEGSSKNKESSIKPIGHDDEGKYNVIGK